MSPILLGYPDPSQQALLGLISWSPPPDLLIPWFPCLPASRETLHELRASRYICRESSTNRPYFLQNKANFLKGVHEHKRSINKRLWQ